MSDDKYENARVSAKASYKNIVEMVGNLQDWQKAAENEGWEPYTDKFGVASWRTKDGETFAGTAKQLCEYHSIEPERNEEAERVIHEDALSVEVNYGWFPVGKPTESPQEYRILLTTGGPAVRIIGTLDEYCEPKTAVLQMQDWFLPWAEWKGQNVNELHSEIEEVLLKYARCFYFGA